MLERLPPLNGCSTYCRSYAVFITRSSGFLLELKFADLPLVCTVVVDIDRGLHCQYTTYSRTEDIRTSISMSESLMPNGSLVKIEQDLS